MQSKHTLSVFWSPPLPSARLDIVSAPHDGVMCTASIVARADLGYIPKSGEHPLPGASTTSQPNGRHAGLCCWGWGLGWQQWGRAAPGVPRGQLSRSVAMGHVSVSSVQALQETQYGAKSNVWPCSEPCPSPTGA